MAWTVTVTVIHSQCRLIISRHVGGIWQNSHSQALPAAHIILCQSSPADDGFCTQVILNNEILSFAFGMMS